MCNLETFYEFYFNLKRHSFGKTDKYMVSFHMLKKSFISILAISFIQSTLMMPSVHAAPLLSLPEPGKMVNLSVAYNPAIIKGVTVNKDNPFLFDFIVDPGQDGLNGEALKIEGEKQIKYFLAALTVPAKDLWVNLSPYEKDRTINDALGQTDMGRDLLAQDYILKQLTASLIYPEKELGKTFWNKVYDKTQAKFGDVQIPVNTFNKVWIMADQAEVYEHGQTAFVTKSHLKVLLDTDYLAQQKNEKLSPQNDKLSPPKSFIGGPGKAVSGFPIQALGNDKENISSQIIREVILPELEREVNEGKNFAPLRQIFNAIILAGWYKNNLKTSLLNQTYADKSTVNGIDLADQKIKEKIYNRYLEAYKKGVFNYVKEDVTDNAPRKYFSGGVDAAMATKPVVVHLMNPAMIVSDNLVAMSVQVEAKQQGVKTSIKEELQKRMIELNNLIYSPQDLIDKTEAIKFIVNHNPFSLKPNKLALIIQYVKNLEDGEQGITKVEIRKFILDLLLIIETETVDTMVRSEQYMLKNNVINKQFSLNLLTLKELKNVTLESMNPADKVELDSGIKIEELWETTRPELASLDKTEDAEELNNVKFLRFLYALLRKGGNPAMLVEQRMNKDKVEEIVDLLMEIISGGDHLENNMVVKNIIKQVNNNEEYSDSIIEEAINHMLFFHYFLLDPQTLSLNQSATKMSEPINAVKEFLSKFQLNGWDTTVIEDNQNLSHIRKLSAFEAYLVEGLSRLINNMESGFQGISGMEVSEGDEVENIVLGGGMGDIDITRPAGLTEDSAMIFQEPLARLRAYLKGEMFIASKDDAIEILSQSIKVKNDFKKFKAAINVIVQENPSWFLKNDNFDAVIRKIKLGRAKGITQVEIEQFLEEIKSTINSTKLVLQQENKNSSRLQNLQRLLVKIELIIQAGLDSGRGDLVELREQLNDSVFVTEFHSTLPLDQAMANVNEKEASIPFYPRPIGLTSPLEMIDDVAQFRLSQNEELDFTSAEWGQVEILINLESRNIRNNQFSRIKVTNRPLDQMIRMLIKLTKQPTRENIERAAPYLEIWEGIFISDDLTIERKVFLLVKNLVSQYKTITNTFDVLITENSGEPFSLIEKSIIFEYIKGLVALPNTVKLNENMEGIVNASAKGQNSNFINSERRLGTIRTIIKTIIEIRKQGAKFEINDEVKALLNKYSYNLIEIRLLNIMRIVLQEQIVLKYRNILNQGNVNRSALLWFDEDIALSDTLKSLGYSDKSEEFEKQIDDVLNYVDALVALDKLPINQSRRNNIKQALKDVEFDLRILVDYYNRNKAEYEGKPFWNNIFEKIRKWLDKVRHIETLEAQLNTLNTIPTNQLSDELRQDAMHFTRLPKASNQAMSPEGGIDLKQTLENTAVTKEGLGVQMQFDSAMIERVKKEGIHSLSPVIFKISPVVNIWNILGIIPPKPQENRLVGA